MAPVNGPVQTLWALGDYHRFAAATVWQLGPVLVNACEISPGQRVLDVAAGTGNVAIRAAQAGAHVVASDVTVANFEAGRLAARQAGVDLEWVEGDAAALPFNDGDFDVVASCFGAMFAADQRATAAELVRVCRPRGAGGDFFHLLAAHAPAPSAGPSPLVWGTEEHVRGLLGDSVQSLTMARATYVETAHSPREYFELFRHAFGPVVAIYASFGGDASRIAQLDAAFAEFIARWNDGPPDDGVRIPYEYLLVLARR